MNRNSLLEVGLGRVELGLGFRKSLLRAYQGVFGLSQNGLGGDELRESCDFEFFGRM